MNNNNNDVVEENHEESDTSYFLDSEDIKDYNKKEEEGQSGSTEVRLSNECYNKVLVSEFGAVFFAAYGMALGILIYECRDSRLLKGNNENLLLWYNSFCTFALLFATYTKYYWYNEWLKARG